MTTVAGNGSLWPARGREVLHGAARFWTGGSRTERAGYVVGAVLLASGLVHLVVLLASGGTWSGPVSFRKPTTFGVAFGLTLVTMSWVSSFLALRPRTRAWLGGVFAVACVLEVALITVQAWRGVPSHYNLSTPFDAVVARVLAVGGAILVAYAIVLTVAAFRRTAHQEPGMRLALRAGFLGLLLAMTVGAVMIAMGVGEATTGHQQAAYVVATSLKPAHAVTMHAVLVLPLLYWLLGFTSLTPAARHRVLRRVVGGYAVVTVVVVTAAAVATLR